MMCLLDNKRLSKELPRPYGFFFLFCDVSACFIILDKRPTNKTFTTNKYFIDNYEMFD